MPRRAVPAVVLLALVGLGALAAGTQVDAARLAAPAVTPDAAPAPEQAPGERYRFSAHWNGIPVARAELVITPDPAAPADAVRLEGRARTNEFLDLFWRMRNRFDAVVPLTPTAPGTFYLEQNENRRMRQTWIERDDDATRLVGRLERPGKRTRHGEAPLYTGLHDPASVAYLIKHLPADLDTPQTYDVFEGRKIYSMTVTPAGEEDVFLMGRRWRARKLRLGLTLVPRTEEQRQRKKPPKIQRADIWISADAERVLLRMVAGTWWGRVTIAVTGHEPAGPARVQTAAARPR